MTGWRLGWLVVPEGARDAITELVEVTHSGVAPFIQHAGVAAVHDTDAVERFRAHCAIGRTLTGDALSGLNGVRYAAPDGAFYAFVGVEGLTDSLTLGEAAGDRSPCRRRSRHCVRRSRRGLSAHLLRPVGGADRTRNGTTARRVARQLPRMMHRMS